jgi:hypothetical protein
MSNEKQALFLQIVNKLAATAKKHLGKVHFLSLLSLLSACWLLFYITTWFDLSLLWLGGIFLVLSLPALVFFYIYFTLLAVAELPEQIEEARQSVKTLSAELKQSEAVANFKNKKNPGWGGLGAMSKALWTAYSVSGVTQDAPAAIGSALFLASPWFVVIISITSVISGLLVVASVLTGLIYWL